MQELRAVDSEAALRGGHLRVQRLLTWERKDWVRCSEPVGQGKPNAAGRSGLEDRSWENLVYFKVQEGASEDKGT